jgi:transcriptional regulator with XRE-family HTH domain
MTVGENIRSARKAAGMTQKQLGEILGVSGSMIGQYENGLRNPKTGTIVRIANAIGVPNSELSLINTEDMSIVNLDVDALRDEVAALCYSFNRAGLIRVRDYMNDIREIEKYRP